MGLGKGHGEARTCLHHRLSKLAHCLRRSLQVRALSPLRRRPRSFRLLLERMSLHRLHHPGWLRHLSAGAISLPRHRLPMHSHHRHRRRQEWPRSGRMGSRPLSPQPLRRCRHPRRGGKQGGGVRKRRPHPHLHLRFQPTRSSPRHRRDQLQEGKRRRSHSPSPRMSSRQRLCGLEQQGRGRGRRLRIRLRLRQQGAKRRHRRNRQGRRRRSHSHPPPRQPSRQHLCGLKQQGVGRGRRLHRPRRGPHWRHLRTWAHPFHPRLHLYRRHRPQQRERAHLARLRGTVGMMARATCRLHAEGRTCRRSLQAASLTRFVVLTAPSSSADPSRHQGERSSLARPAQATVLPTPRQTYYGSR